MKKGRPTTYCDGLADLICERIADGESLRAICRDPEMPSTSMVFRWLGNQAGFRDQYELAKEEQAELFADEIIHIADSADDENSTAVQKARLQVDARKWVASNLKPKRYGDKVDVTSGGDKFQFPQAIVIAGNENSDSTDTA